MEGEENSASAQPATATKTESLPSSDPHPHPRKKKHKNKRRFSDEQIRSLESIFKSETRLDPRKKLQLARELGLQPRQVAIWFQNRRARWKSKQIEQDYKVLKANYDNLHFQFESLKKEKEYLFLQLQKLSDLGEKSGHLGSTSNDMKGNSTTGGADSEDTCHDNRAVTTYSDDEEGGNGGNGRTEEPGLLNMSNQVDVSVALPEKWCNFDSTSHFDQSCGSSNWWDIWN